MRTFRTNNIDKHFLLYGGLAAAAFILLPMFSRNIAKAATGAVIDTATGTVVGVGEAVGIPATDKTQCEQDLAAGRKWDASFSCPAGTFIGSFF